MTISDFLNLYDGGETGVIINYTDKEREIKNFKFWFMDKVYWENDIETNNLFSRKFGGFHIWNNELVINERINND